jgi:hypothetical protein
MSELRMAPLGIEMMLHFHTRPTEPFPDLNIQVRRQQLKELFDAGLMVPGAGGEGCYATTPLGEYWCEALCAVAGALVVTSQDPLHRRAVEAGAHYPRPVVRPVRETHAGPVWDRRPMWDK